MINKETGLMMKLFCGSSHPKLGSEIAQYLGIELGKMKFSRFSCGEIFTSIEESIRGMNAFLIQTAGNNVNEDLMELFIAIDSLKRASARTISVVIPHFGYARQDKKAGPREPISAKLMANLITTAGATRVITMDLHADQIQGYFDIPVDHMTSLPLFVRYFENKKLTNMVVVAPDTGRAKTAKKFADRIGAELAILHKTRPAHNKAEIMHVVGDVKDKTVLLFDDMVDTGGSVTQGIEMLKKHGCNPEMYLAATHAVFSGPAIERLSSAGFKEVVVTNTIPLPKEKRFKGLKILSTAPLFAEAIARNHNNLSISEIFE
ncbi:MAG: ribose-phosphate pyrophosphokinase [Candidatus Margulisbacteria bacterium GWF2_35_9]|nr:MAG: ribose-phosphate pyrophosphokinase [Candidatus Margulisbacteria bacterium GWF2_35_9]